MFTKLNLIAVLAIPVLASSFLCASEDDTSNKGYRQMKARQERQEAERGAVTSSVSVHTTPSNSQRYSDTSNKGYREMQARQNAEKSVPTVIVDTTLTHIERHSDTSNKGYREMQARQTAKELDLAPGETVVAKYETVSPDTKKETSVPDNK